MRKAFLAVFGAACVLCGLAVGQAATGWPAGLQELVASEKRFAATCGEKGIRDSFLMFFADDVFTFAGGLKQGKDHLRNRPAPQDPLRYKLQWTPVYGDISAAGDIGYTTGPYVMSDSHNEGPPQTGTFFSIWKRNGAEWRVVLDFGTKTNVDWFSQNAAFTPASVASRQASTGRADRATELAAVARREGTIADRAASAGIAEAICQFAAANLRLNRDGVLPLQGKQEGCQFLSANDRRQTNKLIASGIADSGDLAYTVGEFESVTSPTQRYNGYYVRIWKRDQKGQWQIALDAAN